MPYASDYTQNHSSGTQFWRMTHMSKCQSEPVHNKSTIGKDEVKHRHRRQMNHTQKHKPTHIWQCLVFLLHILTEQIQSIQQVMMYYICNYKFKGRKQLKLKKARVSIHHRYNQSSLSKNRIVTKNCIRTVKKRQQQKTCEEKKTLTDYSME